MTLGLLLSAGLAPVAANADVESVASADGFGYWASTSFEDLYAEVTETETPERASALFADAIEDPEHMPALDGLSEEDRVATLKAAADAALGGASLPTDVVTPLDLGLGAPILGQPIANGFAWQHKDRYYWRNCDAGPDACEVADWMDFTYTVDPGGSGTRVTVSTLTWGSRLTGHKVSAQAYRDASTIILRDGPQRQGDGTYTIKMNPHLTLTGYTFALVAETQVWGPQGSSPLYYWRTGPTSTCSEPVPGAWRCIFL